MSMDHDDYATFARIEDHLRRIADALERIPAVTVGEFTLDGCDDRTCTDRDHWAPTGRINHGDTPTTCTHGQDHPDDMECEYRDNPLRPVRITITNRKTGATLFDGDMAKLPADLDLPPGGWSPDDIVQPMADPLDESDHRPRRDRTGGHWTWRQADFWCDGACRCTDGAWELPDIDAEVGPLTFCDCDDATIEAENGATD